MNRTSMNTPPSEMQRARANQRWYAARAKPRREGVAITHLNRQHFATYCPLVQRTKRYRGRSITAFEPLFPGYIFVAFDRECEPWHSINGTIGVIGLVSFGLRPAVLPTGFVEQLQNLGGADGLVRFDEKLQPGDGVRIVGGPFDGLSGSLMSGTSRDRVSVLLKLLSGETKVSLARSSLVSA